MEENRLGAKVVGVETVDNLTEPQLVAKVRSALPHSLQESRSN
jgi:hypothetical protein